MKKVKFVGFPTQGGYETTFFNTAHIVSLNTNMGGIVIVDIHGKEHIVDVGVETAMTWDEAFEKIKEITGVQMGGK